MLITQRARRDVVDLRGARQELWESGSGDPVVYLHPGRGLIGSGDFIEALSNHARVLAPSHPGFGASELPDWMNSVEDLSYHYLDLLDALALENVTLVGSSFGGWIAAAIAVKPSPRVRRLVLIDPVGVKFGAREERDIVDIWGQRRVDLDAMTFHDPEKARIDYASLSDDDLLALARNREAEALFGWSPYMHDPKLVRRLHRIVVPTLVLWGASDRIVTPDYGRAYARAIPGARFEMIENAGHLPQIERAQTCADAIVDFVAATAGS